MVPAFLSVAGASANLYLTLDGVYFLPAGLLVGNAWEAWRRVVVGHRGWQVTEPRHSDRSAFDSPV